MRSNVFLRDMNINVAAQDSRRIEVLAQDLPCFSGARLAVDTTLRSALTSNGEAHPQAADVDGAGAVLIQARRDIETGGRWSEEAVQIVRMLAFAKAREVPSNMQFLVALMWERRWTRMLATTCAVSFAASLSAPACGVSWCQTGGGPPLSELVELEGR